MFARRSAAAPRAAAAAPARKLDAAAVLKALKTPYSAAAGAAAACLGAVTTFVAVLGDPTAGTPVAKVEVQRPQAVTPAERRSALEAFTVDTLGLFQDLAVPGFETVGPDASAGLETSAAPTGAAVITLPGDDDLPLGAPAPPRKPPEPLPTAPIAGLSKPGPFGPVPAIGPDGRTPFAAYARPFRDAGKPKVALVVGGLGLNPAATRAAIERLPPEVTLSFVPYAEGLQGWIDLARAHGHEVLLEIPMEPAAYPDNDPGPHTLLVGANASENQRKLDWLLARATGYFGVTNYLGERFMGSEAEMAAFQAQMKAKGLAFVDDGQARRASGAYARASADRLVDESLSAATILQKLAELESIARARGSAVGSGFAYPLTVEAATRWAATLEAKGLTLAPVSAVSRR
jgi:polysaccharide deacetylase 2 family uncharacterized protein YibQ